ncbi:hypothetical protein [Desulfocastanea catecholica]
MKNILHEKILYGMIGKTAVLSLFLLIAFGLVGCAGVGRLVPVDERILFDGTGAGQGSYRQGGLTVVYSYRLAQGNITVAGEVDYSWGVDSLDVRLRFLDAAGIVLQEKIVASSGYRVADSWKTVRSFQQTMAVPPGAAGISFSYSAQPRRSHQ